MMNLKENFAKKESKEILDSSEFDALYLEALKHGSILVDRLHLMIVGQYGAGKSSLVNSMCDAKFDCSKSSTDGTDILTMNSLNMTGKDGDPWKVVREDAPLKEYVKAGYHIYKKDAGSCQTFGSEEDISVAAGGSVDVSFASAGFNTREFEQEAIEPDLREFSATRTREFAEVETADNLQKAEEHSQRLDKELRTLLQSPEGTSEDFLKECFVSTRTVWDLGGQDIYLATHSAFMPKEDKYTTCAYILTIDMSVGLDGLKKPVFCEGEGEQEAIVSLKDNSEYVLLWCTGIGIAHPEMKSERTSFLGKELGVDYPPVFIAGTHADKIDDVQILEYRDGDINNLVEDTKCFGHIVRFNRTHLVTLCGKDAARFPSLSH